MITKDDLREAIAECQGQRNPNANTCIKLAAYLILKRELYDKNEQFSETNRSDYSYAAAPNQNDVVRIDSDTEFARVIGNRKQSEVFPVIDELMTTLKTIQPRLYDAVLDKLY